MLYKLIQTKLIDSPEKLEENTNVDIDITLSGATVLEEKIEFEKISNKVLVDISFLEDLKLTLSTFNTQLMSLERQNKIKYIIEKLNNL